MFFHFHLVRTVLSCSIFRFGHSHFLLLPIFCVGVVKGGWCAVAEVLLMPWTNFGILIVLCFMTTECKLTTDGCQYDFHYNGKDTLAFKRMRFVGEGGSASCED